MKAAVELNEIEKQFVAMFDGNVEATAHKCGMSAHEANKLVKRVEIRDALRDRELIENPARKRLGILSRYELQEFWSNLVRDELMNANNVPIPVPLDVRHKAADSLAKCSGMFSERRIHEGPDGGPVAVLAVHVESVDLTERTRALVEKRAKKALPPTLIMDLIS